MLSTKYLMMQNLLRMKENATVIPILGMASVKIFSKGNFCKDLEQIVKTKKSLKTTLKIYITDNYLWFLMQ